MRESQARERLAEFGRLLRQAGLAPGSSGNLSVRIDGGWLITPTNSCLGLLDPARIARLDEDGRHVGGDPPSKEVFMHRAIYAARSGARAIVHTHSTHAVAWAVAADVDPEDVLPPLTAYYVMKIGKLPLVPYYPPGDLGLADAVRSYAERGRAMLLANHGPIVAGSSLDEAVYAMEELEETAKLALLLGPRAVRVLTPEQLNELKRRFPPA